MNRPPACPNLLQSDLFRRRELLRIGGLSLLGMSLPQWIASQRAHADPAGQAAAISSAAKPVTEGSFGRAKRCIFLFMWGGPAHQDTWDLKPNAPAEVRGEFKPISTKIPGIQICEHLPQLAQRMDKLAIVRSLTHTNVDHLPSTHYLLTGQPPPPTNDIRLDWPHMGSVLAKLGRGGWPLPPFVSMRPKVINEVPRFVEQSRGQFAGWLGQAYDPMTIDEDPSQPGYRIGDFSLPTEMSIQRLDHRRQLLAELNQRQEKLAKSPGLDAVDQNYRRAFDMLADGVSGDVFRLDKEPQALRERYGLNPHGQSVLQARRLIERGVPLVTVFWPNEGIKNVSVYWDTHSKNFIDLKERLMPVTDRAFSALLDDLEQRGMLEDTLVIWAGEFGRTPKIGQVNSDAGAGRDGRDHWPGCFSAILAGGGIRGGQVYGASDRFAAYPASAPTRPMDLVATVYHALGVSSELTLQDNQGRPMVICHGSPIRPLLS